uniref:Uncharacterized protein n=1 Tax=Desmophyllum pertusum TaxID=174260 RepID=A0A9X0D5T7_9CNID|nr:hypothetical protein OS493_000915 [Desmophyllum pertusum]
MAERFCSIQKVFFYDTKPEETQGHLLQNSLTTMLIGHWASNNIIDAESCNLLGKNASNVFSCKGSYERGNDLPVELISLLMDRFSFEGQWVLDLTKSNAFYELMRDLEIRRGENTTEIDLVPSSDYLFVPGDIVAVNPGTDNGIPSSDKWWLLQVNKPHASSRDRPGCQIFGFWLNEHTSDESTSGKHFTLLPDSVKVYFGSIIQDNKITVVVPVEELNSDWQNGHVVYTFTNEYCNKLDELSNAFRRELNLVESGVEESDVDSDSDDDDGQHSHIHEVELTAMQHRRRMMRNVEGQVLTSYRELSNPRPGKAKATSFTAFGSH